MDLKVKYSRLISYAQEAGVQNLNITEDHNVLHISGTAPTDVRDKLWNIYNEIDPDMRAGDLVLNVLADEKATWEHVETYEVKPGDSLSKIATKYSGMTWQKIFDANRDILTDADKVYPGQKLRIPKK